MPGGNTTQFVLYRHFDSDGLLLYIGVSMSVMSRIGQHKTTSKWFSQISNITLERLPSRREMYDAEIKAIIEEKPLYNTTYSVEDGERLLLHIENRRKDRLRREFVKPDVAPIDRPGICNIRTEFGSASEFDTSRREAIKKRIKHDLESGIIDQLSYSIATNRYRLTRKSDIEGVLTDLCKSGDLVKVRGNRFLAAKQV